MTDTSAFGTSRMTVVVPAVFSLVVTSGRSRVCYLRDLISVEKRFPILYSVLFAHEITGEWRRLHNEELNDLYSSPNIVRVIKSRKIGWAGRVAGVGR